MGLSDDLSVTGSGRGLQKQGSMGRYDKLPPPRISGDGRTDKQKDVAIA